MLSRWLVAGVCSRRGSAHRRRGQPCQDATLQRAFTLPGGQPLTLLAVADGHGGPAYHHSDVGSFLACETAADAVAAALSRLPAGTAAPTGVDLLALRRWLAEELPTTLQQRWLAAVREHWLAGPGGGEGGVPFSPLPYGSTLGLLLLTPRWWALSGLGDWDLVRVDQAGAAELLSQEVSVPGAGEATASLCQEGADRSGWFRSWVWPLEERGLPFALVLCTDGLRKSCASDADFLALAAWLAAGPEPSGDLAGSQASAAAGAVVDAFLAEALDRISAEGCGDDVSVAIGTWQAGDEESPPPPEPSAPSLPQARPSRQAAPLRGVALLLSGGLALLIGVALGQRLPLALGPAPAPADPPPPQLSPAGREALRLELGRLCRDPAQLKASLSSRPSQVQGLRQGTLRPQTLLSAAARDPLGALITASFLEQQPKTAPQMKLLSLEHCPELRSALANLWLPAVPPAHRPSQGAPAAAPPPRASP
jgi:hypothetical protein